MARFSPLMIWMDLEMTGLDPERDRIIEIATIITDGHLNIVEEGPDIPVYQPDSILQRMDEWNVTHHGSSGLIEKVRFSSIGVKEAEHRTLEFIKRHIPERSGILCGNSIHQDRRFIRRYMRKLDQYLHYRMVDVTSVKELAQRWMPEILQKEPEKKNSHRALDDILESIEELRFYKENVFRTNK